MTRHELAKRVIGADLLPADLCYAILRTICAGDGQATAREIRILCLCAFLQKEQTVTGGKVWILLQTLAACPDDPVCEIRILDDRFLVTIADAAVRFTDLVTGQLVPVDQQLPRPRKKVIYDVDAITPAQWIADLHTPGAPAGGVPA